MPEHALLFGLVVAASFTVEAALGFGSTVVAVSLAAFLLPIDDVLYAFVPLNLVLSTVLVARNRSDVDVRFLVARLLPFVALGLPLGFFGLAAVDEATARHALGAFVAWLAAVELWRERRPSLAPPASLSTARRAAVLWLAGVVHGAFATGGPLVVYVAGRTLTDKGVFRATLSALWLVLNLILLAGFVARGALDGESGTRSLVSLPFLVLGLVVGDALHRRVSAALFRRLVFVLLLVAGALLMLRA